MRKALVLGIALFLIPGQGEAHAESCGNPYRNACIHAESLFPHATPSRFMAVGSSSSEGRSKLAASLLTSYRLHPVMVTVPAPGPPGTDHAAIEHQITVRPGFVWGVSERLSLEAQAPVTVFQTGAGTSPVTAGPPLPKAALGNLGLGAHYRLSSSEAPFGVAVRSDLLFPTGNLSAFAGERGFVFAPGLVTDARAGKWFFGAEAGARIRPVTQWVGTRVGSALVGSLGAGVVALPGKVRETLALTAELFSVWNLPEQHDVRETASGFTSAPNGRHLTSLEWLCSVRTASLLDETLTVQLGAGGPIPLADVLPIGVPTFRAMLGIRYVPNPAQTKPYTPGVTSSP